MVKVKLVSGQEYWVDRITLRKETVEFAAGGLNFTVPLTSVLYLAEPQNSRGTGEDG